MKIKSTCTQVAKREPQSVPIIDCVVRWEDMKFQDNETEKKD